VLSRTKHPGITSKTSFTVLNKKTSISKYVLVILRRYLKQPSHEWEGFYKPRNTKIQENTPAMKNKPDLKILL
jgi:hypothetical protein